jgi:glutathione reductase (NADPH)|tara:strand:+ start:1105 stop:2481 length:1377 start_codon:yes stop_codon:yes gene_type:complete
MNFDYDLFVLGAGSGGVRASRISASYGAKVAVAESMFLGGTCVNVGCVPKKLFVYGSHFHEDFADAKNYGWQVEAGEFDWPVLRDNKTREIERLNGIYANLLDGAGVELFEGHAQLVDANTIKIGDKTVTAKYILVATGGWPVVPDIPGKEYIITSNEAFYLPEFPKEITIVGGGYIAVEFAGIFAGLGAKTTLVYRGSMFLRGFDDSVRSFVKDEIEKKGINLRFETNVTAIEKITGDDDAVRYQLDLTTGEQLHTDLVLYATGRKPKTANLGLEQAGVALGDNGQVLIDDYYKTSVDNIFAIGDVTDRIQLTPVAIEEGMCIANNLFTDNPKKHLDYRNIATAVFCQPNIGTVGLTEAEALVDHTGDLDIFESRFKPMKHTISGRDEGTFLKMIVRRSDDVVLGIHMVGPDSGEIIQGLAVAMVAGATKAQFDATVGIHPTAAEEFVTLRSITRGA